MKKIGPEGVFGNPTLVFASSNFEHDLALTNAMPGSLDFSPGWELNFERSGYRF